MYREPPLVRSKKIFRALNGRNKPRVGIYPRTSVARFAASGLFRDVIPGRRSPRHIGTRLPGPLHVAASRLVVVEINEVCIAQGLSDSCVFVYNFTRRSLNAFPITETELKLIAAAAIIGLNSRPKNG